MMLVARGSTTLGLNRTRSGLDPSREIIHASMYRSLRVNQPRQIMGFSDYPFLKRGSVDPRNFPGHEEVLRFLHGLAEDYGLIELIRFGHEVVRVERAVEERRDLWAVEWRMRGGEEAAGVDIFDAVVVCSRKYTQPKIAEFPGRSITLVFVVVALSSSLNYMSCGMMRIVEAR
ncbi:hypothetical protein ACJRO7_018917 [Eucalyptus globulus]|uniref:Flavin-containing monooxygenase n=1 Tax=Eucalyptus globulus TaxID=34317 RepID=A0ABD3KZG4_EUCGL